jgi:hypothetical protein
MKSLKESLLNNIEDNLNKNLSLRELCPLPTNKDWKNNPKYEWPGRYIDWICKELIHMYNGPISRPFTSISLKNKEPKSFDFNKVIGLRFEVISLGGMLNGMMTVYLLDTDGNTFLLSGVGNKSAKNTVQAKSMVMRFIKHLADHPELINELFKIHNNYDEKTRPGKSLDEIIK